ncbi:YrhB domain-containing protein [Kitasatospora sp. LaBMicrA B282]|uniref:YrhB domain-containing protein n=1 Tax=Kitasatospora sp. LaBMicrA B282 TaxID=3420949 RepID=UPI003D0E2D97
MFDREYAQRIAQEDLDRSYSGRLMVSGVEARELVWIVHYQTAAFLRSGDPGQLLAGNGPYLVDRIDGGLHQIGPVSYVTGEWEGDYRQRIRKMPVRTAVDDLHDEIRQAVAEQGRIMAMHLLRQRVPSLVFAEVVDYVTTLETGSAPEHLVAIATKALVPPLDPVLMVETIQPGRGSKS